MTRESTSCETSPAARSMRGSGGAALSFFGSIFGPLSSRGRSGSRRCSFSLRVAQTFPHLSAPWKSHHAEHCGPPPRAYGAGHPPPASDGVGAAPPVVGLLLVAASHGAEREPPHGNRPVSRHAASSPLTDHWCVHNLHEMVSFREAAE